MEMFGSLVAEWQLYRFTGFVVLMLKVTLLISIASVAALLMRRSAATTRHFVWFCALSGAGILPVVSTLLSHSFGLHCVVPVISGPMSSTPSASSAPVTPQAELAHPKESTASPNKFAATASRELGGPIWLISLLGVYGVGLLAVTLPMKIARTATYRLARESRLADPALQLELDSIVNGLGIRRLVSLRVHPNATPMTWGWHRPIILLPSSSVSWEPERLRVVLLHETAHIVRHDWLTQTSGYLVCVLYWFHPLLWFAAARLRAESELACDDRVVLAGVPPDRYARHLLEIARLARDRFTTNVRLATPMARPASLEARLRTLLDSRKAQKAPQATYYAIVTIALATLILLNLLRVEAAEPAPKGADDPNASKAVAGTVILASETDLADAGVSTSATEPFVDGGKATFIAVGERRPGASKMDIFAPRDWWRLDGTRCQNPLGEQTAGTMPPENVKLPQRLYEFTILFTGLTSQQFLELASANRQGFVLASGAGVGQKRFVQTLCLSEPVAKRETSLRIGLPGNQPWREVARVRLAPGIGTADQLAAAGSVNPHKGAPLHIPDGLYESYKLQHDVPPVSEYALLIDLQSIPVGQSSERGISLLDSNGKLLDAKQNGGVVDSRTSKTIFRMSEATAKRASYAVIESRPYQYVTFSHISLVPKGLAAR